ncbi:VacJ family lipoprotein [Sphingomonas bacterium]|uniref:MlaA family lipoprotein n=1 Tax=Sphingomonas bacterium TaxID=1895847 RepID=UPI001576DE9D|nr:VacJ family lipoprotein [Sphingomonas bacterium]
MTLTAVVPALLILGAAGQTDARTPVAPPIAAAAPIATDKPEPTTPPPTTRRPVRHAAGDPFERFNRKMFARQQRFDRIVFRPVALGYKHVVPSPLRTALRHFFSNLGEPIVFLNYMLQLKPGKAIETVARFTINSTLGLAGAIDLAKGPAIRLPHRPNGLADTLGFYGVKPGPYIFLPFIGPTTLRDLIGNGADGAILAPTVGEPFDRLYYQLPHAVIPGLDERVEADGDLRALMAGAVDPYATLRSVYLQDRAGEIRHLHGGKRATGSSLELGDPLADPAGATPGTGKVPELADPMADPAAPAPQATQPDAKPAPPISPPPALDDPLKDPTTGTPARPTGSATPSPRA